MAAGSQLSIPTPLNYTTTTGQLPPSGRYMFINVLPESPPYCIFCCTARRMTLQPCRGKQEEQGLTVSLWSLSRYKGSSLNFSVYSPKGSSQTTEKWFQGPFRGYACLPRGPGLYEPAHTSISNPRTPGLHSVLSGLVLHADILPMQYLYVLN